MEKLWVPIIKSTGAVGVISYLIYTVVNHLFNDQIIKLFGSEKLFVISLVVLSSLLIILLVAVLIRTNQKPSNPESGSPKVNYNNNSIHNGDNNF